MGYETRLLIGKITSLTDDEIVKGELVIRDGEAYHPYMKDDDGNYLKTGIKETWFKIYAEVELCICGHESKLHKLKRVNEDEGHHYYWYNGDKHTFEDPYGDKLRPVPLVNVIEALKADIKNDGGHRRFKWALALLESMENDEEDLHVLLYGH